MSHEQDIQEGATAPVDYGNSIRISTENLYAPRIPTVPAFAMTIHSNATQSELFAALATVLPVETGGSSQWVELVLWDGSTVTVFGPSTADPFPVA